MNFETWWEAHAKAQGYDQMDEAICQLCYDAAKAAWDSKPPYQPVRDQPVRGIGSRWSI